jgi:hypothetical protein
MLVAGCVWLLASYFSAQNQQVAGFWLQEYLKIFVMFLLAATHLFAGARWARPAARSSCRSFHASIRALGGSESMPRQWLQSRPPELSLLKHCLRCFSC